jgi:hypothetical protein
MRAFSFYQTEIFLLFQYFVFFIGLLFLFKGWHVYTSQKTMKLGRLYPSLDPAAFFILCVAYPSTILFVLPPMREYIFLCFFFIYFYGLVEFTFKKQKMGVLLLGIIGCSLIRFQFLILLPAAAYLFKTVSKKSFGGIFKSLIAFIPFSLMLIVIFEKFTPYRISLGFLSFTRNRTFNKSLSTGMSYGNYYWETLTDFILDAPLLFFQFLASPLPIIHTYNWTTMRLFILDIGFVLLILGVSLVYFKKYKEVLILFFISAFTMSIFEFFIGGAVRHRMPLVFLLIPIFATECKVFKRLIQRILNRKQKPQIALQSNKLRTQKSMQILSSQN